MISRLVPKVASAMGTNDAARAIALCSTDRVEPGGCARCFAAGSGQLSLRNCTRK